MGRTLSTDKPYKIYAEVVDNGTLDQFESAMMLEDTVQGALMADAHRGYSLPIGGVIANRSMVYPSWVGYDIGCGMCACRFEGLDREDLADEKTREEIFKRIYEVIPVGFNHHKNKQGIYTLPSDYNNNIGYCNTVMEEKDADYQVGTLGGGNHFIEIGHDEEMEIWCVIHSGSRNFGWKVAQNFMKLASGDGRAREGHFGFHKDSDEGKAYLYDMGIALEFALLNRLTILERVEEVLGHNLDFKNSFINSNHNHADIDMLNGEEVIIHRKGATHAEKDMMGVIPGNMRDGSFIVRGLGNPDSLWSSSHGAGRVLGRKKAKESLDLETFRAEMAERGITAKVEESTLDESAGAYKNIFEVMAAQKDLVEIIHHVKPIINVKA